MNNADKSNQYIFSSSDAKEYITTCILCPELPRSIFIYYDDKSENISNIYDKVKNNMETIFTNNIDQYLGIINKKNGQFKKDKFNHGPWGYYYSVTKDE